MPAPKTPQNFGRTADGVDIVDGLVVITNEMRAGVVDTSRVRASDDGWFDVVYADGRRVMQNAERVATRFRGLHGVEVATEMYAADPHRPEQEGSPRIS